MLLTATVAALVWASASSALLGGDPVANTECEWGMRLENRWLDELSG